MTGAPSRVIELRAEQIELGSRIRPVDPDQVAWIKQSMADTGRQLQPIAVRPPLAEGGKYRLVLGAHRISALDELDWPIRSEVVDITDDEALLLEADENLARHDLTELDRSYTLARRKEVYERLHPEAVGKGRKNNSDNFVAISFTRSTAEKLGVDKRSIERAVARFTRLAPGLHERIAPTSLARKKSELDLLVSLAPEIQEQVVNLILSADAQAPRNVGEACRRLHGEAPAAPVDPSQVAIRRFVALWEKAPLEGRQAILQWLADNKIKLPKRTAGGQP
jgi:ParB family chromosome partitioning protein